MSESDFWKKGFHYFFVSVFFLGLSIYLCWTGISEIAQDISLENWNRHEALIESTEVQPLYQKGSLIGNRLVATYSYSISGRNYQGNRVALDPTFSNSPQEMLAARKLLENAVQQRTPLPVMIDPENPENSLLFKSFPFKAYSLTLAGAAVFGAYLFLEILFLQSLMAQTLRNQRKTKEPEKPWTWENCWQSFTIPTESPLKKALPLFAFTIICFFFSLALVILVLLQPQKGFEEYSGVAFIIFFNSLMIFKCLKKWRGDSWAKSIELQALSYPARPGETWKFRIIVQQPQDMEILAGVKIFLKFKRATGLIEPVSSRHSGNRSYSLAEPLTTENDHTCFQLNPTIKSLEDSMVLELEASLPKSAESTNLDDEFPAKWHILMYFSKGAKEFIETFEIPVYSKDEFSLTDINPNY